MKNNIVKNLVVGTIALLSVSYVLESYLKNKKRNQEIEASKQKDETVENTERNYYTIGTTVVEDGKMTTKSVKEYKKVI